MISPQTARRVAAPTPGPLPQVLLALLGGAAAFPFLLLLAVLAFNVWHAGRVFPGVSVSGVDVSGLRPAEAAARLAEKIAYTVNGRVVFEHSGQTWQARPAELGLYFDAQTSAQAAYLLGREGGRAERLAAQMRAWRGGAEISPLLVYDQRAAYRYLEAIAAQLDKPTIEAEIRVENSQVIAAPGQVGRSVDIAATLAPLQGQMRSLSDGVLPLVIVEKPPLILDASAQAEAARRILSAPLTLRLPDAAQGDPGPWSFEPQALAGMLTFVRSGSQYQVGLEAESLRSFLLEQAPALARQPADARFIFNDDTHQLDLIQPAVTGRALNVDASLQAINAQAAQGGHDIALVFDYTQPAITDDATAEKLGIRELVSVSRSYFYGSSAARIQNIVTAAARFHGVFVPPGATFSMGDILGDVSLDSGYAEALIIYGNRTIKGVGGGVCQVSTTLFRAAFYGGYPIVERHPHAYRVSYYELTANGSVDSNLAGLDATVFTPVVDFKFTNDTGNWLLMETYVNVDARVLTWKFYSTTDGRTVEWYSNGPQNVEEPPEPLYQENPALDAGEIRQVDWEAQGADVNVYRTVYRNGQIYLEDQFVTHYLPWRAVYEYGPGTKLPKDRGDE